MSECQRRLGTTIILLPSEAGGVRVIADGGVTTNELLDPSVAV
jgi:hypothetical protein